jgi:site-specific recombinase XerD
MALTRFSRNFSPKTVTANEIRLFILSLQQSNLKPGTVHIYYRSLKTFFNWMVSEELLVKSPMSNIKPPKLPRPLVLPYPQQDIDNLVGYAGN